MEDPLSGRPSKRVPVPLILSSFPAPPSHIPNLASSNPPPTGPPACPLPPLPSAPSRISEHEQLFILSSVRSRRSSNYSQRDRDSIVSSRSPSSLGRSVSRSNSLTTTTPSPFHTRPSLSDISDSDTEAAITSTTSPVLSHSSPRRLLPNDSISSIDMRDVLRIPDVSSDIPPTANRPSNSPLHSPHRSLSGSYRPTHARSSSTVTAVPAQSQVQTPIQTHKHSLSDLGGIVVTKTTTTTTITSEGGRDNDHMTLDELSSNKPQSPRVPSPDIATILSVMPRPALSLSRSRSGDTARSTSRSKSRAPGQRRVVSVSNTKHPDSNLPNLNRRQSEGALTTTHTKAPSSELAYLHKRTDSSAMKPPSNKKRPLSRSTSSTTTRSSCYDQDVEDSGFYDEALERVLEGEGSEDEGVGVGIVWDSAVKDNPRGRRCRGKEEGDGGDSDSSLDLHTPLPYVPVFFLLHLDLTVTGSSHLMLRHGLLSPNSKLLPQAECSRAPTPLDERPGSILSVVSIGEFIKDTFS
jgi:hypothetical protein